MILDTKYNKNPLNLSEREIKKRKKYTWISIILGLVIFIIIVIFFSLGISLKSISELLKELVPFIFIPILGWVTLYYLKKSGKINLLRKTTLLIALIAFLLTELGRSFYRPFIYANNINDYFIADTIGNSLGTATAIFFILTISGKGNSKDFILILIIVLGLLLYEASNLLFNYPVDIHDMISTVIFGIISGLLYWRLLKKSPEIKKFRSGDNEIGK